MYPVRRPQVGWHCGKLHAVPEAEFEASPRPAVLQVNQALRMRGGGLYEVVGPGQGTDDTEMTLCLAHALATSPCPHLPLEAIAQNYCDWSEDTSMDIGWSCLTASSSLPERSPRLGSTATAITVAIMLGISSLCH